MFEYGNLIGGEWCPAAGAAFATHNPARPTELVGRYTAATPSQVDEAVRAGQGAQTVWRRLPSVERGAVVERFVAAVEAMKDELARAISMEQGKPLAESRGETAKSCAEARFMIGEAARSHSQVMPSSRPGFDNSVVRRPRGIIAALTPWNFPVMAPMRKIVPALVFGNAVILKPSEYTPGAACIIASAGHGILPDGLLQVLLGMAETGQALASHPGIDGVAFTGSVPVGKKVYAAAAGNLAEVALELGGKNAAIIHDTDDLDACLDQVIGAAYQCAGQRCTSISRILVHRPLLKQVQEGLTERARQQVLGDGMQEGVTMGPMNNPQQLHKVVAMVEAGVAEGARVLTGGKAAAVAGLENGYFYEPTILGDVMPGMSVAREEIFGPVISVLSYESIDEAFAILNDVDFGLTSSLFTNDLSLVQRFVAESEHGMLHVNHGTIPENHMPFGGIKHSGVGAYSVGPSAVNFYTTEHAVYIKA